MDDGSRGKRQKLDSKGRFAALAKFKQLKEQGLKNKYEVSNIKNVYEEVDEKEYTKKVLERQDDDWLVDNDGTGYVEDGREIFDDDLDDNSIKEESKKQKKENKNTNKNKNANKSNIQQMFMNMSSKKRTIQEDDNILEELMQEMSEDKPIPTTPKSSGISRIKNPFKIKSLIAPDKIGETSEVEENQIEEPKTEISIKEETIEPKEEWPSDEIFQIDSLDFSDDFIIKAENTKKEDTNQPPTKIKKETLEETITMEAKPIEPKKKLDNFFITRNDGRKVLRMYWIDAFEEKMPGMCFLVGKVFNQELKNYVSCCTIVRNIPRRYFFLPREKHKLTGEPVTLMDVYNEFDENFANKYSIDSFLSRKVTKKYAFYPNDIPDEAEYLEIKYSSMFEALPKNIRGDTFSHVLGHTSSALELLFLDKKMKGPCWVDISSPQLVSLNLSWCKLEVEILNADDLSITTETLSPPPLIVMSLAAKTTYHDVKCEHEIVALSALTLPSFTLDKKPQLLETSQFCSIAPPFKMTLNLESFDKINNVTNINVTRSENESALLNLFIAKLIIADPDILIGHNLQSFILPTIVHRMTVKKVNWSHFGRMRRYYSNDSFTKEQERAIFNGRLICDIKVLSEELIKMRNYDLLYLCNDVLKSPMSEILESDTRIYYYQKDGLLKITNSLVEENHCCLKIALELNMIPLMWQITSITGCLTSRTFLGGRAERNEWLLLHAFTEKNYIPPEKSSFYYKNKEYDDGNNKSAYAGGLVLEPKKGLYHNFILLMDFNSLYPSIIQEYNICFTTFNRIKQELKANEEEGILPAQIRKLVESRRDVKKLMKSQDLSSELRQQYDIRQMALKLTANSMYGCLGYNKSRFYALPLAARITSHGRNILQKSKTVVEEMGYEVIYGDTDSLMINTNCQEFDSVFSIGNQIKSIVNQLYKSIELDIDGIFKALLLLKKKKYAALMVTKSNGGFKEKIEYKGLDIVRRDWAPCASELGKTVVTHLLTGMTEDDWLPKIHNSLAAVREMCDSSKFQVEDLAICKYLTKAPKEYTKVQGLPHVMVAQRVNMKASRNVRILRKGDAVEYIICKDGSENSALQRSYHIDEVRSDSNLKPDYDYYLAHQFHPVITRICEPIEGLDTAVVADFLGLDTSRYQARMERIAQAAATINDPPGKDRFRYDMCKPFRFHCMNEKCKAEIVFDKTYKTEGDKISFILEKCVNPECTVPPYQYLASIQNQLTQTIRKYHQVFYQNYMICENPFCDLKSRPLTIWADVKTCHCSEDTLIREFSHRNLHLQLSYFCNIFDLNKEDKKLLLKVSQEVKKAYHSLKLHVEQMLLSNSYSNIDLDEIFTKVYGEFINIYESITPREVRIEEYLEHKKNYPEDEEIIKKIEQDLA